MKEPFDKIIKDKLENFIETNQVDYQPEHWQQLMQKKKAKKRVVFYWRWAAVFVLFLLAGGMGKMFYDYQEKNMPTLSGKEMVGVDTLSNKNIEQEKVVVYEENLENQKGSSKKKVGKENTTKANISKIKRNPKIENNKNTIILPSEDKIIAEVDENTETITEKVKNKNLQDKEAKKEKKSSLPKVKKVKLLASKEETKEDEKIDNKKLYREITVGFDASSMLSYNTVGERNDLGYSGGVSVEIPLFKQLDVQAGVVYSNQKVDYIIYPQRKLFAARGSSLTPKRELSSSEVTVNMIEIPLSLKYHFKVQQQKLFVSAGISASSVLNEKISSKYEVGEKVIENGISSVSSEGSAMNNKATTTYEYRTYQPVVTTQKQLNHFYPISAFQLSLGGEFGIGNKQSIVIEPYYKQFIQPITTKKTTFSNVGVKLQYRFNLKFKK